MYHVRMNLARRPNEFFGLGLSGGFLTFTDRKYIQDVDISVATVLMGYGIKLPVDAEGKLLEVEDIEVCTRTLELFDTGRTQFSWTPHDDNAKSLAAADMLKAEARGLDEWSYTYDIHDRGLIWVQHRKDDRFQNIERLLDRLQFSDWTAESMTRAAKSAEGGAAD